MFRNRSFLFFGLAVGLALIVTVMTYNWLQDQTPPPPQIKEVVKTTGTKIAVASVDVAWGAPLTGELIRFVDYPSEHLPEGRFHDVESLTGRVVVTPLKRNEPILESKLAPIDIKNGGVIGVLEPGNRAMAVRVNEVVGLPGFVKPGDRVDIMVTTANIGGKGQITKTVLENVLVLATGTQMQRKGPGEKPTPVKVMSFEVSLKEAEKLALATSAGKLRLALRSPLDIKPEYTLGATPKSLLASFRAKSTKRGTVRRRPKERVELIIGGKRHFVKF